jgi:transposase
MLIVETIRKVRLAHHHEGLSIREISRKFHLSRNTVRKLLRNDIVDQQYVRTVQPLRKLGSLEDRLKALLDEDSSKPVRHRRTAQILFEQLQREGFEGGYDSVRRYVKGWKARSGQGIVNAFIPLTFAPGEAFQFDWSYERIELGGANVEIKVAHFRLCYSRMPFCVAYTRETLEMVLDGHVQAFEFFGGCCKRGIYDNLKTVVTKVLMGKDRIFNRRFQNLASHYLFEPVACTPASGWEKGQVENQVNLARQRFFNQRRKFADLSELNSWLREQCLQYAAGHKHPEQKEQTIAAVFDQERHHLPTVPTLFDAYLEHQLRVSPLSLISFDRNRYSVNARAVGKIVSLRAYADRVLMVRDGEVVGFHRRHLGRDKVIYDPLHYLEVLKRKPGALRNGAPFKDWVLPEPIAEVRALLEQRPDGDRQFVNILSAISSYGSDAVSDACATALAAQTVSKEIILNQLSRNTEEPQPQNMEPAPHLPTITVVPLVDCSRYDLLLKGGAYGTA